MNITSLQSALVYTFEQQALLTQALTHRSYGESHNERLEFLGDGLLNCIVATELYAHFPEMREGHLSRLRANLVCQQSLAEIATNLQLGEYLYLGEGELKSGGRARLSILADALEALLGAIYLDGGFATVSAVVKQLFAARILEIGQAKTVKDPKSLLQEWLQAKRLSLPLYELVGTLGEAHAQEFEVQCVIKSPALVTLGRGPSRRHAEQQAAALAVEKLHGDN